MLFHLDLLLNACQRDGRKKVIMQHLVEANTLMRHLAILGLSKFSLAGRSNSQLATVHGLPFKSM